MIPPDEFNELKEPQTLAQRRGGHPDSLLKGDEQLNDRSVRKAMIADALAVKASRRMKSADSDLSVNQGND